MYYKYIVPILFLILTSCSSKYSEQEKRAQIEPPEELYGQLFYDVQNSNISIFKDSKTFCDALPKFPVKKITEKYKALNYVSDTNMLKLFVLSNFDLPSYSGNFSDKSEIHHHIRILWDVLTRSPDSIRSGTLIPLKKKYVVPGGRFREVYYWDCYFTMLGLKVDKRIDLIQDMVDNFSFLIDSFGYIPNGNRTYYLSRSQPPFYSLMIDLLISVGKNENTYVKYYASLKKEYNFWMDGYKKINDKNRAYRRLVKLNDGSFLNRYWDDKDIPRSESYKEDIQVARLAALKSGKKLNETYRNIRAAAESGWDFSSRWFSDTSDMISIHTVDIIPVDLNCLLYHLEKTLAKCCQMKNMKDSADYYSEKALERKKAINKYCWDSQKDFYMDYDFRKAQQTLVLSLAGTYPLFFGLANKQQAKSISSVIKRSFLKKGGLVATTTTTNQQWDAPDGWAPLQWISIQGLKNYNYFDIADDIKVRWISLNKKVYNQTGKMIEKYNVTDTSKYGGGGEYPNQDGFGWTNGVFSGLSFDCMVSCGITSREPIYLHRLFLQATNPRKPLQPLWIIH